MFSFLGVTVGLPAIVLYVYVALAIWRAEAALDSGFIKGLTKALFWPITIWHTISGLYLSDPAD